MDERTAELEAEIARLATDNAALRDVVGSLLRQIATEKARALRAELRLREVARA